MRKGNIYADIVDHAPEEYFGIPGRPRKFSKPWSVRRGEGREDHIRGPCFAGGVLVRSGAKAEWVLLLKGSAGLRFEGEE